ncbi:Alkyl hydroperoxide reductase/ Thiol specific antioxidant/ Mal allergen domain protein [mine drainage metagenome]
MLNVGDEAPDFESLDDSGHSFRLSRDGGARGTIICFYPGDFTPICTREVCRLDVLRAELAGCGWALVGVSPDPRARHELFKQRYGLSLRLLCDEERLLFRLYGCLIPVIRWPLRVSWVVDEKRRIRERVHAEFRLRRHEALLVRLVGS